MHRFILQQKISSCDRCSKIFEDNDSEGIFESGDLSNTNPSSVERVRELELELAQVKLAQVEAECKNQVKPTKNI